MTTLTLHATGEATPAEAWDRFAHFARWPDWSPQITGVEVADVRIAQGVAGRVRGPLGVVVPFVVDEVDEPARQWTWSVFVGPARLRLRHWVVPGPDGGATTGLRVSGGAPFVLGYAPLARIALQGLVRP